MKNEKKNLTRFGFALLAAALGAAQTSGCATIVNGSEQNLAIASYPAAQITVTNENGQVVYKGSAPTKVKLKRSGTYKVVAEKEGYDSETFTIDGTFKIGWMFADLFLTGVIGIPIDIATGAPNTLDDSGDNEVEVTLFRPGTKPKQIED